MASSIFFRILIAVTLVPVLANAQKFGAVPPSTRWMQVDSDSARIIFPRGLDSIAREIHSLIGLLSTDTSISLDAPLRKINIVLQNQTVLSNGYVGMGPYRSEFQTTPLQHNFRLGSLPWHLKLALHEYRHVEQYNSFNRGIVRPVYAILGQEAGALLNNVAIPDWFWEGDAVYQETYYTQQGRGRLPFFYNDFKAIWASDRHYGWMKLRNGSLRQLVPDHYRLGYLLVSYGRRVYGNDFWTRVTGDAAEFRGLFYPFQRAVKKFSGVRFNQFVDDALNDAKDSLMPASEDVVSPEGRAHKHYFADFEFPQWTDNENLVYVRSSFKEVPTFYTRNMNTGEERKVRVRDISTDNHFSYRNNVIIYAAYRPDARWGWKDHTEIRVLDLATGKQQTLTHNSRYFSPDLSPNGQLAVAVHVDSAGVTQLHILSAQDGSVQNIIPNQELLIHTYPKFKNDSVLITASRDRSGRMSLIETTISGRSRALVPFTFNAIGTPSVSGDTIVYSASGDGLDRIMALVKDSLFEISSPLVTGTTGNYEASIREGAIAWNIFTATGLALRTANARELAWQAVAKPAEQKAALSPHYDGQAIDLLAKVSPSPVTVRPYSKTYNFFNFHSLRPDVNDPVYELTLAGENILNTFRPEVSVTYNRNEQSTAFGAFGTYGGLFPWLRAGADYTINRNAMRANDRVYWNEIEPQVGFIVPLNLTSKRLYRLLRLTNDFVYNKQYFQGIYKDSFDNRGFGYVHSQLQWTSQMQSARQQIHPSFAQSFVVSYRKAVTRFNSNQFLASGFLYFPGFARTNSLVLTGAFQQRDADRILFSNIFPFSRGYEAANFRRMYRLGANYHLPLFYPEAGLANIIYFLRIRSNLFFDFTRAFNPDFSDYRNFRSTGVELFFDTKWWNQQPVSFGVRFSRRLDPDLYSNALHRFELILPINLLGR